MTRLISNSLGFSNAIQNIIVLCYMCNLFNFFFFFFFFFGGGGGGGGGLNKIFIPTQRNY
jgi:hypothetical protein